MRPRLGKQVVYRLRAPLARSGTRYARDWENAERTTIRGCAVQPLGGREATVDREFSRTAARLIAPRGTDLAATDRIEVDGAVWEMDGEPQPWRDLRSKSSHVEAMIKRLQG